MSTLCFRCGMALLAMMFAIPVSAIPAADEILVANPYARAVPPMMENSAMFLTLKNTGASDRALVSASSRAAEVVELHTHVKDGDVMRMRQIDKIEIKTGQSAVLEPGGLHVMLIGLKRPLMPGSTVQVDLHFDDGSSKAVVAPIKSIAGMHAGSGHAMQGKGKSSEPMSPVFINLTTDDNWRAGMALHWARMALKRGHKVTIWLNVEAVRIAVKRIGHPIHAMQNKSAQEMLQAVAADGATVLVCPGCLKRAGFNRGDLIGAVSTGSPNTVMPAMFDSKTKVISW